MKQFLLTVLLFAAVTACSPATPQPKPTTEKAHMIWVKIMKAEVSISGDCASFDKNFPNRFMERKFSLKEAKQVKGNLDIQCDVPNRKTSPLDKQYSAVIKHLNGAEEKISMNDQADNWIKLQTGKWCKMNQVTLQINVKNCRRLKP